MCADAKLNLLHIHMTDDQSWPLVVPAMPELAKLGAFSADHTYSPDDIKGLIEYGRLRGVRVVLEIECAPTSVYLTGLLLPERSADDCLAAACPGTPAFWR